MSWHILYGPHLNKILSSGFLTKGDLNQYPQLQGLAKKIDILPVASLDMTLSKKNNKGPDQSGLMCRLVCAYVVRNPTKTGFLASRPIY